MVWYVQERISAPPTIGTAPTDMPSSYPRIVPCGEAALVVEFGDTIDEAVNGKVLGLDRAIAQAKIKGVIEAVPTYRSLLVHYDPLVLRFAELSAQMRALVNDAPAASGPRRRWRIPGGLRR